MNFAVCIFETTTFESVIKLITLIVVFVLIIVACYATTRFVGNQQMGQLKNSNFKVIDTFKLAPNKFLQIIKVGERYFLIAVSKESVTYITELSEDEIKLRTPGQQGSFKDILTKFAAKSSTSDEK